MEKTIKVMIELIKIFKAKIVKAGLFLGLFSFSIIFVMVSSGKDKEKLFEYLITLFKF